MSSSYFFIGTSVLVDASERISMNQFSKSSKEYLDNLVFILISLYFYYLFKSILEFIAGDLFLWFFLYHF